MLFYKKKKKKHKSCLLTQICEKKNKMRFIYTAPFQKVGMHAAENQERMK